MIKLLGKMVRTVRRWRIRQDIADIDSMIRRHEAQLKGLPKEIDRLEAERRVHVGRHATLGEERNPVNHTLGRVRVTHNIVVFVSEPDPDPKLRQRLLDDANWRRMISASARRTG